MTKNLIEEVQELVQQIKTNFQEGVDFEIPYWSWKDKQKVGAIHHLSPRLKSFLRKKFDFPPSANDWLDYSKTDSRTNYYYRLDGECGKGEFEGLYFYTFSKGIIEQKKPKKCLDCGELTFKENGRIWYWNKKKRTTTRDVEEGSAISYFHPECAKKYFADKERPNQSDNSRIKEKLLRNLDKICIDPLGDLANAELLMDKEIENKYYWNPNYNLSEHKKIAAKVYKVEIEGEEIDLEKSFYTGSENYCELKRAIIQEIKQNPQEWKIGFSSERPELQHVKWTVQHQSGRRHWKTGIERFWPDISEKEKYWAEIEILINGSKLPINKPKIPQNLNDTEKNQIKKFMEQNDIVSLKLVGGKLLIEYNNKQPERKEINNPELQAIKNYLEKQNDKSLNYGQLKTSSPSQPNKPNYALWISIGVGGVAFGMLIAYFIFRRKRKRKRN